MEALIDLGKLIAKIISEPLSETKQFNCLPEPVRLCVPARFPVLKSGSVKAIKKQLKKELDPISVLAASEFRFDMSYRLLENLCKRDTWTQASGYVFLIVCHAGVKLLLDLRNNSDIDRMKDPAQVIDSLQFVCVSLGRDKTGVKKRSVETGILSAAFFLFVSYLCAIFVIFTAIPGLLEMTGYFFALTADIIWVIYREGMERRNKP